MNTYVYNLNENTHAALQKVGGKAANLMELANIKDIHIPQGFCITTDAYAETFKGHKKLDELIAKLAQIDIDDMDSIIKISSEIRNIMTETAIPHEIAAQIKMRFESMGKDQFYAVRSSATAEDLPGASFAGQHDTYLNAAGYDNLLKYVSKCWASLFTDRAVIYRMQNGFSHKAVQLAVIVQQMIPADVSGVMFTADPVSSNRKVLSIDACYGLGEGIVSGRINADHYQVTNGQIIDKNIVVKDMGIYGNQIGGTTEVTIADDLKGKQVLAEKQILALEQLGRTIESHYSYPQDIEWCILDNQMYILQSRPITTLYPLPDLNSDEQRVYISSGHLQMMTDTIKPLGMYFFKSVIGGPPSKEIGGRVYLDLSNDLSTPIGRAFTKYLLGMLGDTLMTNAVLKLMDNKELMRKMPKGKDKVFSADNNSGPFKIMINAYKAYRENDPDVVKGLIAMEESSIKNIGEELSLLSGDAAFEYIAKDHENRRKKIANPRNAGVLTAVMLCIQSFDKKIKKYLGETNAADSIIMSVPNSITTETGYLLMDVADVIREYPKVIEYLKTPSKQTFFDDINKLEGGKRVSQSLRQYLVEYGMRCSGDIDITAYRWIEDPTQLAPIILSNIANFEPGASGQKHEQGKIESEKRIDDLVSRVSKLPMGKNKARKIKRMAKLIRNYIGFREYPKFSYMKRYYLYKQAMLKEAEKLVEQGVIDEPEDIYYLYFDELRAIVNGQKFDSSIIAKRKSDYANFAKLTPPRVMTSDGEVVIGEYENNDFPENALPGLPVSAGVVEGRARVVKNLKDASFEAGDILVTEFTDPSWTPTFVSINGLVTEVGGLTTHGAVIAREYGLPAVVSVKNATKLIKDGQVIRLNGSQGYIELL